ncbi:MAG: universal stress protein [Deltaproteobacteria bacterium]|nr:universal stress protein [Deltaproteobacteria bacterium]
MFKKILVPLDGSKLAEKILPRIKALVKVSGAKVQLLRVVMTYEIDPKKDKVLLEKLAGEAREYLDQVTARLKKSGIQASGLVVYGKDAVQICDYAAAKKFNLIAMSTHGRSGLSRWAMGSVADKVLHCSSVPVMLFRVTE